MSLSHKLDHEYETIRKRIIKLKPNIHRRRQVRVKNWLKKLDEPTTVLTWQRLRNKYAKNLVKQMTTEKDFSFPFNKNAIVRVVLRHKVHRKGIPGIWIRGGITGQGP